MSARPFGRIYKPKWASDEICAGPVTTRGDGSWACDACGAKASRFRKGGHGTEHRRMVESPYWTLRYSHEGKRHNISTHSTNHADAVKLKKEILRRVLGNRLPWLNQDEPTLDSLLEMVRTHYVTNGNRSMRSLDLSSRVLRAFPGSEGGKVKARKITEAWAEAFKAWGKGKGWANGTVNRPLAVLRQGLKMAAARLDENGRPMIERAPLVRLMREAPPKQGFFEDDEFDRVHAELLAGNPRSGPEDLADLALLFHWTGWRNAESRALLWANINWFSHTIELPAAVTKAGKPRTFPFGPLPQLEAMLKRRRADTEELERSTGRAVPWVFHRNGKPIRWFRKAWQAACERAGVTDRTPHDFRRSACRRLIGAGVDPYTAAALVGWESTSMVARYRIGTEKDREAAVAKLAAALPAPAAPSVPAPRGLRLVPSGGRRAKGA